MPTSFRRPIGSSSVATSLTASPSVNRLGFDLESGELHTPEGVTVKSEDFEIAGVGLEMVWNQADNRVETLSIARGDEFVLFVEAGLFGATGDEAEPGAVGSSRPTTISPPRADNKPLRRKGPQRKPTAYACTLTGQVIAAHYRGPEVLGGLEADEVRLLFDAGISGRQAEQHCSQRRVENVVLLLDRQAPEVLDRRWRTQQVGIAGFLQSLGQYRVLLLPIWLLETTIIRQSCGMPLTTPSNSLSFSSLVGITMAIRCSISLIASSSIRVTPIT